MEENLGNRVSAETISSITDRILSELKARRSRPLEPTYAIVWIDTIHYKVFDESGRAVSRAIYNVPCIDKKGNKDVLGMYISKSEGADFRLSVLTDLKSVYKAVNKETAEDKPDDLELKWGEQYPIVIKSWRDNWERLTAYFAYTEGIRRIIYTTNTVEGCHCQLCKVTKNKGVFLNDTALEKLVYLAYRNIKKMMDNPDLFFKYLVLNFII